MDRRDLSQSRQSLLLTGISAIGKTGKEEPENTLGEEPGGCREAGTEPDRTQRSAEQCPILAPPVPCSIKVF